MKTKPKQLNWWDRPDCRLRVMEYNGSGIHAVEVVRTYLQYPIIAGTLAIVVWGSDQADVIRITSKRAEAIANRIAADPSILDTLNDPNVLDLRSFTQGTPGSHAGMTDADIDAFAKVTRDTLRRLNIDHKLVANSIIAMPDGTMRMCYSCDQGNDRQGMFLGERVSDYGDLAYDFNDEEVEDGKDN